MSEHQTLDDFARLLELLEQQAVALHAEPDHEDAFADAIAGTCDNLSNAIGELRTAAEKLRETDPLVQAERRREYEHQFPMRAAL